MASTASNASTNGATNGTATAVYGQQTATAVDVQLKRLLLLRIGEGDSTGVYGKILHILQVLGPQKAWLIDNAQEANVLHLLEEAIENGDVENRKRLQMILAMSFNFEKLICQDSVKRLLHADNTSQHPALGGLFMIGSAEHKVQALINLAKLEYSGKVASVKNKYNFNELPWMKPQQDDTGRIITRSQSPNDGTMTKKGLILEAYAKTLMTFGTLMQPHCQTPHEPGKSGYDMRGMALQRCMKAGNLKINSSVADLLTGPSDQVSLPGIRAWTEQILNSILRDPRLNIQEMSSVDLLRMIAYEATYTSLLEGFPDINSELRIWHRANFRPKDADPMAVLNYADETLSALHLSLTPAWVNKANNAETVLHANTANEQMTQWSQPEGSTGQVSRTKRYKMQLQKMYSEAVGRGENGDWSSAAAAHNTASLSAFGNTIPFQEYVAKDLISRYWRAEWIAYYGIEIKPVVPYDSGANRNKSKKPKNKNNNQSEIMEALAHIAKTTSDNAEAARSNADAIQQSKTDTATLMALLSQQKQLTEDANGID